MSLSQPKPRESVLFVGSIPKSYRLSPEIVLKMFKRVEKRRRKKEEEEKLGLDEEVKEILGMQDTDSEESESDSDSDQDEEEEKESLADNEEMNSGEEDEDEEDHDAEEEDPSITVSQALKDPLYIVSVLPDIKACIVCPGKLLKSTRMVQLHRTSNACTLSLNFKNHFIGSPFLKKIWNNSK